VCPSVAQINQLASGASGVYKREDMLLSAMALQSALCRNGILTVLRSVTVTNSIQRSLSNYFPVDEHIYGLTEEQKQVITHLYIFHQYPVFSAEHCLGYYVRSGCTPHCSTAGMNKLKIIV
jgi:hypothetical protein